MDTLFFLSFSQYLENYLWVNYTPEVSSHAFLMSICCIVNEKFRENVPAWEVRLLTSDQVLFYSHAVITTTIIIVLFL